MIKEFLNEYNEKFPCEHEGCKTGCICDNADIKKFVIGKLFQCKNDTIEKIIKDIDVIEVECRETSMDEWRLFKHIRNTLRDKYIISPKDKRVL